MTQPFAVKFVFVVYLQLLIWNALTVCIHSQAVLTTDKRCYAKNEAIRMSWNYRSRYTVTGTIDNYDSITVYYDRTIPFENQGTDSQMYVYVSTLSRESFNTTIRNSGSVVFDGNPPVERNVQEWPLNEGYYKIYLLDILTRTIYTSSDAFVVGTCIQTNKVTYQYNEPISVHWNYLSSYTTPIIPWITLTNYDSIAIYNSNDLYFENRTMYVAVSTLTQSYSTTIRNNGVVIFDGNSPNETGSQNWPLKAGGYAVLVIDIARKYGYASSDTFTVLAPPTNSPTKTPTKVPIVTKTPTNALPTKAPTMIGAILTTDKRCYAKNETIQMSWNYRSRFTDIIGAVNHDVISIFYYQMIPTLENQGTETQMFVYVSTLDGITSTTNTMIRDSGSVVFDGNPPDEAKAQTWPLNEGYYKSYLFDSSTGSIYTSSDAFVVGACIHTNKTTYEYNEPISVYWNYLSNYTTPILPPNYDSIAIYNSNEVNLNKTRMWLAVSTLTQIYNTTIQNNGVVIFDGNSPNETGSQKWPLQAGEYTVRIVDLPKNFTYVTSDTFTVLPPPTKSPTTAPTKSPTLTSTKTPTKSLTTTPTKAPMSALTKAPSKAPINTPGRTCGLFGLGLFCPLTFCGFFGRLILGNRNC